MDPKKLGADKEPFLLAVIKAKYYPNSTFWISKSSSYKSLFWSSITQLKPTLCQTTTVQLQQGNSSIWSTPWCPFWESIHNHLQLPVSVNPLPQSVADLWLPNSQDWNAPLTTDIFYQQAAQLILQIQPVPAPDQDTLRWTPSKKGNCTAREAFHFLNTNDLLQLPH